MKKKEENTLKNLITKVGKYKPKEVPKKSSKSPTTKQLKEIFFLDEKSMTIKES